MSDAPEVDLKAIEAELSALSPAELAEQVLKLRTRQKTQQKRQYASGKMKTYQLKQREKNKTLKELAVKTAATQPGFSNLWEELEAQAETAAEKALEESVATETVADQD